MAKQPDVPRELDRAGRLCLAFANTKAPRLDNRLPGRVAPATPVFGNYRELVAWSRRMGALDDSDAERLLRTADELPPKEIADVFRQAIRFRDSLMRLFNTLTRRKPIAREDLDLLNRYVKTALAARHLVQDRGFRWAWDDAQPLDRMLWPIALSASDLLLSDKLGKVRQCAARGCLRLFVGRKRRKWCDMNTCGSRFKGKRHYEKSLNRQLRPRYEPPLSQTE